MLLAAVDVPTNNLELLSHVGAPVLSFAGVTALAAMSAVVMQSSGNPPAEMPVTVPDPLIVNGMIKQCSKMNRMVR
jgi:hypothetical protein